MNVLMNMFVKNLIHPGQLEDEKLNQGNWTCSRDPEHALPLVQKASSILRTEEAFYLGLFFRQDFLSSKTIRC